MAKPEWGIKRNCAGCGARFYDLKRDPIICPKCEAVFDPDQSTRLKRARSAPPAAEPKAKPSPAAEKKEEAVADDDTDTDTDTDTEDVEVDDEDDAVLEDASDLNDDDALEEIVDGVEKPKTDE